MFQYDGYVVVYDWVMKEVVGSVGWEGGRDGVYCRNYGYWLD